MSHAFWLAIGLLLIAEGIGPFLAPDGWRRAIAQVSQQSNNILRRIGGCFVVAGLIILYFYLR
ncbi:hypothetical protein VA7868_04408 [Vibrio aerogenes CECT 7868]|uniref:DUF2065 domain-containing protein n=1 Tax=Vibrio aerogenes CECT 7868 TaxID=1216006 RepID=A0A1M6E938_9VIBR|nr:DUF2065 domain-containing protein [Vibrio aerogenes]SHI82017.1 hypothetical protein VA7868_04408 [Vibrio aerogenes CECT 7868]